MSHLSAVNLAIGWRGVSTHALLLRPSNHIYAAVALSQSKVNDADRSSPSAELAVVSSLLNVNDDHKLPHKLATAGSCATHSEMLRTEKARRKGTESAQRDKPLDWSRGEAPSTTNI